MRTLAALPQFLRFLGTFPRPQAVVDALARGPLAHVSAEAAVLSELREGEGILVALGSVGQTEEEAERYGVIPVEVDLPITRAIATRSVVVAPIRDFGPGDPAGVHGEIAEQMIERLGEVTLISLPIIHADRVVGGLGFVTSRSWEAVEHGVDLVDALSAALGVWMTHPRAGLAHSAPPVSRAWSLAFTPRQREVLRRVEDGEPTPAIAFGLGVSESSVKADLQSAMRALRTSDRREAAERARMLGLL